MRGPGQVMDLFKDDALGANQGESQTSVTLAQQLMDAHTTQLDTQDTRSQDGKELEKPDGDEPDEHGEKDKKGKRGFMKRLFKKD